MTRVGAAMLLLVLLPVLAVTQLKETRIKTEEKAASQFSDYEPQWRRPKGK